MTALLGEIQNESLQLFRSAGRVVGGEPGMTVARIEGLEKDGSVLLKVGERVYRLYLAGVRPDALRRGLKVLVREADLPGLTARTAASGSRAGEKRLASSAVLEKAWRGPWGELRLGRELQKLFALEKGPRLAAIRKAVLDLDRRDLARSLRGFVRDSGLFYEAKVARMALGQGKIDAAKLRGDLKYELYRLREQSARHAGKRGAGRAAERIVESITAYQCAARQEELYYQRSLEVPYWDGDRVKSMNLLWRRPRAEEKQGPCSVTLLLREGELGAVQINIMADRGRLAVNMNAAAPGSCRRLAAGADDLLASLRGAGWQVSSINVRQRELAGVDQEA